MIQNTHIDQLLLLCKEKDERAQLEVYQRYHLAMYHSALRIVQNPVDAEDIMQEGFITALDKLDQYKGNNKFGGWLKQIVIRKALRFVQIQQNTPHYSLNEYQLPTGINENDDTKEIQLQQLQQGLNQLKSRYRNVLVLLYFEGYDYEEISSILNISYGNCRTLVSRAKDQLKQKIKMNEDTRSTI